MKLRTLSSLLDSLAKRNGQTAVLTFGKEGSVRWSYAELSDRIERLSAGLSAEGIGRGDNVALLADTSPAWIVASLAVIRTGAVVVPIDSQFGEKALVHILNDSDARLIFTTIDQIERIKKVDSDLKIILLDDDNDDRSWRRWMAEKAGTTPSFQPDEAAVLFYTSGTTGPPKGVPLSHANLAYQLNTLIDSKLVTPADRLLLPLPLHHVYPFVVGMLAPLALGVTIVIPHSLTGPQLVRTLREGEVTIVAGVPRLYRALYSGIEAKARSGGRIAASLFKINLGLSLWMRRKVNLRLGKLLLRPLHKQLSPKLRVLASGGSSLDPELAWRLEALGWQVAVGYGLTETSPLLTLDPPGKARIGSVGRPIPGVEIRIDTESKSDEEKAGKEDRSPEQGEVLARGPNVFAGYRNLSEKNREAFTEDGWFKTGDLGRFDKDGYLYILGRVSTMIITESGEKVQPDEVEEVYQTNPAMREIGVLQRDRRLVALIVPESGKQQGEVDQAIRRAIEEQSRHLPSYQRITDYALTTEPLPRTRLGKIRRHLLAERYERAKKGLAEEGGGEPVSPEEMSHEDRALLEDETAKQVWEWITDRYPGQRVTLDTSPQLELGIDSLEWLNLTIEIGQRTGAELNEEAIGRIATIRDLLNEAREAAETGEAAPRAELLKQPEEYLSEEQRRWLNPPGFLAASVRRIIFGLNRTAMRGLFGLQVKGFEHLPESGSFVITPNHVSYIDPFAVAAAIDFRRMRQTYWAGWTGVAFSNPLSRFFSRLAQIIPIDPDQAVISSLAFSAAVLKRQQSLVWFPEGGRSTTGELQQFKSGIGLLLEHYHPIVVPVYIKGAYEAWPPHKTLPRFQRITVVFGVPQTTGELEEQGEGEERRDRIAQSLHDRVAELGRHW
jgi:long-chain acyl-CoA synthetase